MHSSDVVIARLFEAAAPKVKSKEINVRVVRLNKCSVLAIAKFVENNGGQGRNRTADAGLFRAALYQLSYLAMAIEEFAV